jgi:serine O-acetyltransferase
MDKATHPFVLELLDSYRKVGGLNNQDAHNTPSKRAIGQICEDLLRLLFPGFHDDDAVEHDSLLEITSERMEVVVSRLEDQVRKSVRIGDPKRPTGRTPPIMKQFCRSLPEVREALRTDIEAAFDGDSAALGHKKLSFPTRSSKRSPFSVWPTVSHLSGAPVIPRMMTEWAHGRTGIDIHPAPRSAIISSSIMVRRGGGGNLPHRPPREALSRGDLRRSQLRQG